MIHRIITTSIAALLVATECMAWGQKGHDTTCAIAEKHLTRKARHHINKLLEGKSIVYWANWLDNASNTPEYAYSKTWHYKNIDEGQTYDEVPPFEKGDIITALTEQINKLKSGELTEDEERLALKMVIHLVGDLHQPMHMGHKTDLGGNRVQVTVLKQSANLHSAWDTSLVESAHKWSTSEWVDQIDRADKKTMKAMGQGTLDDWAKETYALATQVYADTPEGTKISYDYVAKATPVIEQQLLKGGIRLAKILNDIY